jgi:inosine-uridine nucleoside N-ribohydrolase
MRVWIDTDLGTDVDDALAIAYALRHPALELVGISTVFGDVELRTHLARALLERAGGPQIPLITGLGKPLSPKRPGMMIGHEGLGLLEAPTPRLRTDHDPDAAGRIDALADALTRARPDVVAAIGPMTNLGALAERGTRLPPLVVMGGKLQDVTLEGMVPGIEEWNWFCDPVAVQHVLAGQNAVPPRIVPAEVTWRTELADGDVERLAAAGPLGQALSSLCREWLRALRERLRVEHPRVALHDPLTLATLTEPGLCRFEARTVAVDDEGVVRCEPGSSAVEAAVDVDAPAAREHLMETWLRPDAPSRHPGPA